MTRSLQQAQDEQLLKSTRRLNSKGFAVMLGLMCGLALFLATNWLVIKGGPPDENGVPIVGPNLSLLSQYFIGYEVTFLGSLIGFVWAFGLGAVIGLLIGRCYSWIGSVGDAP